MRDIEKMNAEEIVYHDINLSNPISVDFFKCIFCVVHFCINDTLIILFAAINSSAVSAGDGLVQEGLVKRYMVKYCSSVVIYLQL